MSLAIFRNAILLSRFGAAAWGVILALWALLVVSIFPSVQETEIDFEEYLNALPAELQAVVGVAGVEQSALMFQGGAFTFAGFLNIEYLSMLPLMLGIYAVVYCGGLVSKEVERGTLDVVLSQPVERATFLLSKLAGFLTLALGVTAASALAIALSALFIEDELSAGNVVIVHAVSYLLAAAIAGYSTLASCLWLDPGRSLAAAGIVTAVVYFANVLGTAVSAIGWLKYVSLFHYYDSLETLANGAVNWTGVAVYAGVFIVAVSAATLVFRRKDLVR